jgi:hypothetical protein
MRRFTPKLSVTCLLATHYHHSEATDGTGISLQKEIVKADVENFPAVWQLAFRNADRTPK